MRRPAKHWPPKLKAAEGEANAQAERRGNENPEDFSSHGSLVAGRRFPAGLGSHNAASPAMPNGVNYASHLVDLWIVVSLGVCICLITGFLYSLQTPRGFVKYR